MIDRKKFTCPHCGGVFGIGPKGEASIYSYKIYTFHVNNCEKKPKQCKSC
jgi:hypothetical protein